MKTEQQFSNSKHFHLQQLAEGVYAAIHIDGGTAIGNAGIVDLGDHTLVYDTLFTPQAGEDLHRVPFRTAGCTVEEMRLRFDAPTEVVVANAHCHATLGTCSRCVQSAQVGIAAFWRSPYHLLRGTWSCILHRTDILMGPDHHALPDVHGRLVCYGDCTRELAQEHGLPWISGCPPSVKEHLRIY